MRKYSSTRMRPEATLHLSQVNATMRRLGYVASRVHEVIISNLIAADKRELAELYNDIAKPIVDALLHFELEETSDEEV